MQRSHTFGAPVFLVKLSILNKRSDHSLALSMEPMAT